MKHLVAYIPNDRLSLAMRKLQQASAGLVTVTRQPPRKVLRLQVLVEEAGLRDAIDALSACTAPDACAVRVADAPA